MKNKKMNEDSTSLKIVSYWFSIPRIWRRGLFWLIIFMMAIAGWVKLLKNYF
ncbi:hypothetical protein ACFSKI_21555 [Pseudogracilibacillus auburnensis]|uniref:Uncharacterized protein n=1 Tax=Pseudogracilibacillus auburnensis TaxID=1494959 RepID=A0A2V3VL81_9BACI|nr:hypothetical protein [Pseudogracilibacillus auburnensis]MBO1002694.1 hypothetical protein [Pseudogracilibacillus auburnensis]PXW81661.1 hypothetical protein DFR56_12036 [Pseudogracilibacillus auburnensis]